MELTRDQFADSVHEVVTAAVNIYNEVGHLLREIKRDLPGDFVALLVSEPAAKDPVSKVLRRWRGLVAAPGLVPGGSAEAVDDEELDEDSEMSAGRRKKRSRLALDRGGQLLFAKVQVHELPHRVEPHLIAGILRSADIVDPSLRGTAPPTFETDRWQMRRLLDHIGGDLEITSEYRSKAAAKAWGGRKIGARNRRFVFSITEEPIKRPLYELADRQSVAEIVQQLKKRWIRGD